MNDAIDVRQLRYFLAVAEALHFGRAALRLHISQPPLSRQIRQLEDQLGVDLFIRKSGGIEMTPAGVAFQSEARRVLAQMDKAIAAARDAGGADGGQFVMGFTTIFDRSAMPDVLAPLRQRFPQTGFVIKGKHSISLVRDIRNGNMDVAFIGLHTGTPGLQTETVHDERLVVALPAGHPLAGKRGIGYDDLAGVPMFWFDRRLNPGYYDHCAAYFASIGFTPNVIAEPVDHHILLGQIAAGLGVALIPASLRKVKYQGVVFRELKKRHQGLSMGVAVCYLGSNPSPVLRSFLALVRRLKQER